MRNSLDTPISKLLIVGAGGSGRETVWLAREALGRSVSLTFAVEPQWFDDPVIDDVPVVLFEENTFIDATHYVVAIGDITTRRRLTAMCDTRGLTPGVLIHPSAVLSPRVNIEAGTIICAGTVVTTNVHIGRHVHINVGCTISHDVSLGNFATLSPGVHLSGHIKVEDGVFLGTGANVINGTGHFPLVLGQGSIIAAGACVTHAVLPNTMVAGVPAIRKR